MTQGMIDIAVSGDLSQTAPDLLGANCLRIEVSSRIQISPQKETRVNLTVHNTSQVGRMGQIMANYDVRQVAVKIPTSNIYIAPEGKTVVYAVISPLIKSGQTKIIFDVY